MRYRSARVFFIETGVGGKAAKRAFDHHLAGGIPDVIISAGFGGALGYDVPVGQIVLAARSLLFSDSRVVNSLEIPLPPGLSRMPDWMRRGTVVTLEQPIEKRAVRENVSNKALALPVCDMESHYLAELSIAHGIPFLAIRSVSDAGHTEIPSAFFDVCSSGISGAYSATKAFAMLACNPRLVPNAIALGFRSRTAARQLSRAILALIDVLL